MVSAFRPGVEDMDMGEMPAAVYALRHLAAVTEIALPGHPPRSRRRRSRAVTRIVSLTRLTMVGR